MLPLRSVERLSHLREAVGKVFFRLSELSFHDLRCLTRTVNFGCPALGVRRLPRLKFLPSSFEDFTLSIQMLLRRIAIRF